MREAVSKVEALQRSKTQGIALEDVERGVAQATRALTDLAHDDGHICFELEADATIPSEYILFHHFRGTQVPGDLEAKIGTYLRRTQGRHGGWALVHEGPFDMSCTVKAYFALKMIGDDIEAEANEKKAKKRAEAEARGAVFEDDDEEEVEEGEAAEDEAAAGSGAVGEQVAQGEEL